MLQLIQSLSSGETKVIDLPSPAIKSGHILIKTTFSLISSGTERMILEFAKGSFLEKIKQQPEKASQVLDKIKSDGIVSTFESVQSKLDQPIELGYCNVGIVVSIGSNVKRFKVGDRVVSNGPHAEIVSVPELLCAHIPSNVRDEEAVFTVLASIGLQGIRLAKPSFGETFVVSGLGTIGLLTAQLLQANGCNVLGIDTDASKCKLATSLNIDSFHINKESNPLKWCINKTNSIGVDGVIITAATTSSDPITLAAQVTRQRGRIILVGVTGIEIQRDLFYKKELSFQVSCSYGPGRYDNSYENQGNDYPIGFVRWTEQRNFTAVLDSMSSKQLNTEKLISHKFPIEKGIDAYTLLLDQKPNLGILLEYKEKDLNLKPELKIKPELSENNYVEKDPVIGVIGAGNYSKRTLIPYLYKEKANINIIVANDSISPYYISRKFNIPNISTNSSDIFNYKICNTVIIATRHDSHAYFILEALKNNMNIFVEKPLCLNIHDLFKIKEMLYKIKANDHNSSTPLLMIGYNRRFSKYIKKIKDYLLKSNSKKAFIYTVNSGKIDKDHWINDINIGGGRLIGEACHFVDLLRFLSGSKIKSLNISYLENFQSLKDSFTIDISFDDGSIGTVHYFSNGSKSFPKERLEIFCDESIIQLDNFRKLKSWGTHIDKIPFSYKQDKGQQLCISSFINAIKDGRGSPIPLEEIFEVQECLLRALES